ncbi:hypothetical protein BDV28DRAFT_114091 [Aspergillus coremiiformis]|uniref:Uncharacterized protein n=1 Tax=Aspergillus coremiiformis TaxID=138285 RepID=A0A5N6Z622_9EURO|nr:hypothetical protein BDV28DRAFT_114091 [Aspergillus coremiiformis]
MAIRMSIGEDVCVNRRKKKLYIPSPSMPLTLSSFLFLSTTLVRFNPSQFICSTVLQASSCLHSSFLTLFLVLACGRYRPSFFSFFGQTTIVILVTQSRPRSNSLSGQSSLDKNAIVFKSRTKRALFSVLPPVKDSFARLQSDLVLRL